MLEQYAKKRDFARTREPAPPPPKAGRKRAGPSGPLTFVIQKHAARRLHYDFRLELDGVLKSWSVPKGPSLDPAEKRLAVMVEDHPLDYGSFEGVIPKGEYGAGQVIVWDNGAFAPEMEDKRKQRTPLFDDRDEAEETLRRGLVEGKVSIFLRGQKLTGSWALVRTARAPNDWLLFKHKDRFADPKRDVLEMDHSVISGLSIQDLKAGALPGPAAPALKPADLPGARKAAFPSGVEPMHATLTESDFSSPDWLFEPKLDGIRALVSIRDGKVKLTSRRGNDITKQYPLLVEELAVQPGDLLLDGEIVALDESGRPSFEQLQQRMNLTREPDIRRAESQVPVLYYAFDLLYTDGFDLRRSPLEGRKALLKRLLVPTERIRVLDHIEEDGKAAFAATREHGLEGLLAKRRDSVYESGRRSKSWLKIKTTLADEFVVGGYSRGQGGREDTFGALLLGQHDDDGQLRYAGHVGSGFDDRRLAELRARLDTMVADERPFVNEPPLKTEATWVRPELVVEVKFAQWTGDGHLRAPVFLRLREDKSPREVVRAELVEAPASEDDHASPSEVAEAPAGEVERVLAQLEEKKLRHLEVQGERIAVNNLDKEFWPAHGDRRALTKRDLIAYFARAAPYLLPHLRDRPLTLVRYPNGIAGGHFYQKHYEQPLPDFVDTVTLFSEHNEGDQQYLLCNNLPTLLWLGQVADLELHTWFSRVNLEPDGRHLGTRFGGSLENIEASALNYPDFLAFDLDPYLYSGKEKKGEEPELNRAAFAKTCQVALWLKELLDSLALSSFVKTSGRTGLHIYVPVLRQFDFDTVRAACETIGRFLVRAHPKDVTLEWSVPKRTGKVFFDYNQNVRGKTLASIYSPRVYAEATVSMPLRWDELSKVYPTDFTILAAPERLAEVGDLWARFLDSKHDVSAILQAAG